jgi:hypothetical protein
MQSTHLTLAAVAALAAAGAARRRGSRAEDEVTEGYHATHLHNLAGIAAHGLQPGSGRSAFGGGYGGHSRGRVFLSDLKGVRFWLSKMEQIANDSSDFTDDEESAGWQPVVLRVDVEGATGGDVYDDKPGQRDSGADAFYVEATIQPEWIEVWTGDAWEPIEEADLAAMEEAALAAATYEEYDNEGWWELDFEHFAPKPDPGGEYV